VPQKVREISGSLTVTGEWSPQQFTVSRDVRNGFFKFGSVLRKTAGSVLFRFRFGFENHWFGSVFFVDQL